MTKNDRFERYINIIIMLAFLIAGFCKIILLESSGSASWYTYYSAIFLFSDLHIFGNIFLGIPMLSAIVSIILLIVEITTKKINYALEYTVVVFYLLFFACGMLFSAITDNIVSYGLIILGISVALIINRIVFHYGIRGHNI